MDNNPRVFISYAHKNQAYEDKVLKLANKLRSEGIDAMIDQYEEAPSEGWPRWMEHQITESEFVLVLCEETYNRKLYSDKKVKEWFGKLISFIKCYMIQQQKQINLLQLFLMMMISSISPHH